MNNNHVTVVYLVTSGNKVVQSVHKTVEGGLNSLYKLRDYVINSLNAYIENDECTDKNLYMSYIDILLEDDYNHWKDKLYLEDIPFPFLAQYILKE